MTAPTPPDTSQAVAGADAAAAQLGAANLDVSVRIDSPGDNGAVAQTIAAQADAAQTAAQAADSEQATSAQVGSARAGSTQVAPTNVAVSVRIGSPGTDGAVTQTSTADAAAQTASPDTAPATAATAPAPSDASSEAPLSQAAAPTQPAPVTTGGASLPSVWTWNWTWTCGDITGPGTTQRIDTGIQGWIWTWNIDTMCATVPATPTAPTPINPVESVGVISPSPPTRAPPLPAVPPDPAQLPQVTEPQLPQPPDIVAPVLPFAVASNALSATYEVVSADAPTALRPSGRGGQHVTPPRPEIAPKPSLPWLAAEVSGRAESSEAPQARKDAPSTRPHARERGPLEVLAFPPLTVGASAAGGTGGGGTGAVAALAVWMLLQLHGLAVLRLPPSRRGPRARVDDIRNRPG